MKKIIFKTHKERMEEALSRVELIKVRNTGGYTWVCLKCNIAYESDDLVLKRDGKFTPMCANITGWFKNYCMRDLLLVSDEDEFNDQFKVIN